MPKTRHRRGDQPRHGLWKIVKLLFPYFKPYWRWFALTLLFVGIKVCADMAVPLFSRGVLQIIEAHVRGEAGGERSSLGQILSFVFFRGHGSPALADLPVYIALAGVATLVYLVAGYFRSYFPGVFISHVAFSIRRALYGHLQCMDLYFFDRNRSGEISSRLTNDINNGVEVFGMTVTIFIFQAVLFAASVYFMIQVSVPLTLAAMAVGALFVINMMFFVPHLRDRSHAVQEKLGEISGEAAEKFGGIKLLQSFTSEEREMRIFTDRLVEHRDSSIHMARLSALTSIFGQTIPLIGALVIIGMGGYQVINEKMTLADLTFFWMMRERLFQPFQMVAQLIEQIARGMGGLDRVFEFFGTRSKVVDLPDAKPLAACRGEVEFRGVSFHYDSDRSKPVLSELNFKVEPGRSVALVGASGAGKTTSVDLISRFYDPNKGAVLVDGHDIREYTLQSLRDNVGVVMQEGILFSGTIRENILYGRPDAACGEVKEALKMANAWDFVAEMPDKLDTIIGERGMSLSGGQRQRLAIARAFLKNPSILILDEATSALDSVSESLIQDAIRRLTRERTTFVIAHRLSTVAEVDEILVLENGQLIERGPHQELLALGGRYAEFHRLQTGNAKEFGNAT